LTSISHTLGTRLKAERESRGFTLSQVSASTKIPVTLLDALERNDLSRWPKGLYRRAFFRSYVTALGLRAEPLVTEFTRAFPDDTIPAPALTEPPITTPDVPQPEPFALSWAGPSTRHRTLRSAGIALLEVACVVGAAGMIAWIAGMQLLAAIGAVALVYYPGVRAAAGRGRGLSLARRPAAVAPRNVEPAVAPGVPHEPTGVPTRFTHARIQFVERCKPVAAKSIAVASSVVVPAATGTGQLLKVGVRATSRTSVRVVSAATGILTRSGSTAARGLGKGLRETGRVSALGINGATRVFWSGVRSGAEHAALLARRQLNRTRQ
jgi:hypothetical protein